MKRINDALTLVTNKDLFRCSFLLVPSTDIVGGTFPARSFTVLEYILTLYYRPLLSLGSGRNIRNRNPECLKYYGFSIPFSIIGAAEVPVRTVAEIKVQIPVG